MPDLLEIEDLRISFRKGSVVNGVSYSVRQGEIVGIVGESGSGKSMHALSVMRLVPSGGRIDGGAIRFHGKDLLKLETEEMRRVRGRQIAMIFQDPISSLNPVYTIGFQLAEMLRRHLGMSGTQAASRAAELLTLVGIPDAHQRLNNYPHQMSGGMRQRVMIAMSIACRPDLIIADEPTTALDVTIQAQIIELVKRLQREFNLTVIWISHDLGVIAGLAETVNVMYAGHIVERGPVRKIYKNPHHPYTVGLLGSMPRLDRRMNEKLVSIPGRPPEVANLPGCVFAPRCPHADQKCHAEMPPVTQLEGTHQVRCWHWPQVAARN
ncbi:MAG: peptide ABC transporter ATP-binding protein [Rhizobiales bacterium 65-79]|jgi:oligopeptide transport system ATP-binding protein|nr:ABC transporter ATP-binding protein [Hyphomicrobiales bacterium]OJU05334.1 MAG: peptide ABC transporter ATP-binding protein [Rhizobiales bacterium 65-79]